MTWCAALPLFQMLTIFPASELLFRTFAFVFGAVVGSFLNVVIYRLPLGLSVNEPKRSFCPLCKAPIRWHHNLPIVGWLSLRGKCADCGARISGRYPAVEALTGLLFLAVWLRADWLLAFPLWTLTALLVAATFIDFDHLIIPDEITWGGAAAGVLFSLGIPRLHGETNPLLGLAWALVGAAAGYALLWGVVKLGKLAFGRKRIRLPQTEPFTWRKFSTPEGDDAELTIGGEVPDRWSEMFPHERDLLVIKCETLAIAGREMRDVSLRCFYNRLELPGGTTVDLEEVGGFHGTLREFVFPREAMGFGDVKFLACIGAFLGWKAVLFCVAAGSALGSVVGLGVMLFGAKARSLKLPFGPYLAAGALVWMFAGPELLAWYGQLLRP